MGACFHALKWLPVIYPDSPTSSTLSSAWLARKIYIYLECKPQDYKKAISQFILTAFILEDAFPRILRLRGTIHCCAGASQHFSLRSRASIMHSEHPNVEEGINLTSLRYNALGKHFHLQDATLLTCNNVFVQTIHCRTSYSSASKLLAMELMQCVSPNCTTAILVSETDVRQSQLLSAKITSAKGFRSNLEAVISCVYQSSYLESHLAQFS